jgi:hypothetical protein
MTPHRCRGLVEIGDAPGGIRRIDGSRQSIEQRSEPAFALAQSRLRARLIEGDHIVGGGGLSKDRDRPVKLAFQKSDCFAHREYPPPRVTGFDRFVSGDLSTLTGNSSPAERLPTRRQIFSHLVREP